MTTDEIWQQIEQHLLDRNWTAVIVWADALQETGEERLAGCVRWLAKRKLVTGYVAADSIDHLFWYCWVGNDKVTGNGLVTLLQEVQNHREWYQ